MVSRPPTSKTPDTSATPYSETGSPRTHGRASKPLTTRTASHVKAPEIPATYSSETGSSPTPGMPNISATP